MSITRTPPYGVLTDDSGDDASGTIFNDAWLQGLLNLLDARWSRSTVTSTGTQTTVNPSEADLLILNNATDLTIRSITAPSPAKPGKRLVIISTGAGHVFLNHQDTSGTTAANRLINYATSGATPLAAGVGCAVYVYDDTANANTGRWRLILHEQGDYITPTYASGDFTASAGTWTVDSGDRTTHAYYLSGRRLHYVFEALTTTTSAGMGSELRVKFPNSYTASKQTRVLGVSVNNAGAYTTAQMIALSGNGYISMYTDISATGTWVAGTNNNQHYFNLSLSVN